MTTASLVHILIVLLLIGAVIWMLRFAAFAPFGVRPVGAAPAVVWPGWLGTVIAVIIIIWLLTHL